MNLALFKKNAFSLVRPISRIGLGCVLSVLASSAFGAATNKVFTGVERPAWGYLTNGSANGAAITWVANATNSVVDVPESGSIISMEAKPTAANLIFSYWSGTFAAGLSDIANPVISNLDLLVNSAGSLIANFTNKANLTVTSANTTFGNTQPVSGTVTGVPLGRAVSVTAIPAANYDFWYWTNFSGSMTIATPTNATTLVTANSANSQIRAFFRAKKQLTVTISSGTGNVFMGSPSLSPAIATNTYSFSSGEIVTLTAQGTAGNEFKKWTPISGASVSDPLSANTFVEMTNDALISVEFGAPGYTLVVLAKPNGSVAPAGTNLYAKDQILENVISALPDAGYEFVKWTFTNGAAQNPTLAKQNPIQSIQMSSDRNFLAHFTNTLTVVANDPTGPGSTSNVLTVVAGAGWSNSPPNTVVGLGTVRNILTGYREGAGDVTPASANQDAVVVIKATANSSFRWTWQKQYLLETVASGGGQIFPATGAWLNEGTTNTISSVPDAGYILAGWTVGGVALPHRDANFPLIMDGYKKVEAIFKAVTFDADDDGLPTWWEEKYGLDPVSTNDPQDGAEGDPDRDGLSNRQEYLMAITNAPGGVEYFMNPINADTDGDGMDDYYEAIVMAPTNSDPTVIYISAAMVDRGDKGPSGNPDSDFKWDTDSGYLMINQPLGNFDEWVGGDGVAPCTYSTVAGNTVFTYNAVTRKPVTLRTPAWPAFNGSDDQTNPNNTDTDNDSFDDGYEYSWDIWQNAHQGESIDPAGNWTAITGTVPAWPGSRRYNGKVPLVVTPNTLEPDFDWIYDVNKGSPASAYSDLSEYQASLFVATNAYPVIRRVQRPEPWCTNPFLWDSDGDGLADGWEMTFGYDPWARDTDNNTVSDAYENPDGDAIAIAGAAPTNLLYHNEVYVTNGFSPKVAWFADPENPITWYVNIQEMIGAAVMGSGAISNAVPTWTLGTQLNLRGSNPRNVDTDDDGMFDGWELYVGFNPQLPTDAGKNGDAPLDTLKNWQEFMGSDVMAQWASLIAAGSTPNTTNGAWSAFTQSWPNKHLPTDPFNIDTDNDQLFDSDEQMVFNYNTNGTAGAGGGLNPCTVDTDLDYLPDAWEGYCQGYLLATNDTNGVAISVWTNGMDGTTYDPLLDYDGDGLYNYQEYMVGACYQFQFLYNSGEPSLESPFNMADNDPYDFFDFELSGNNAFVGPGGLAPLDTWDPAYWADRMRVFHYKRFSFLSGVHSLIVGDPTVFFSTSNPGDSDTDYDGYDDYYELFHGLNPIRGTMDRVWGKMSIPPVPEAYNPFDWAPTPTYDTPYRWGERPYAGSDPVGDFDQDGQVDVQENLTPDLDAVQTYSHTDPSPYFITDFSSDMSYINRFFKTGNTFGARKYWFWDDRVLLDQVGIWPSAYLFSFEINEGFDTDNDLKSDSEELVGAPGGATDPLDDDSPLRQRALFVNGVDSAARMYAPMSQGWHSFRAFTVEAWVKPLAVDGDRVIVERAGLITPGSPDPGVPTDPIATRNFRLGIKDGTPYVSYDGYVVENWTNQTITASALVQVPVNEWTHLAGIYDPTAMQLMLLVNGELAGNKNSDQIPFNGFVGGDPAAGVAGIDMCVTVGAAEENPAAVCDGTILDIKSGRYYWTGSAPATFNVTLTDYFHGWIDEVHLWDGARLATDVRSLRTQKMTRALISSINGVQTGNQSFEGDMGGSENNPKMLYCFTFDGLPNPADGEVPLGYDSTYQPAGVVPWWDSFPYHSSAYSDYGYVKWIQNMASHQPYDPPRDTRMLRWLVNGQTQNFPNTSNPYIHEFIHGLGGRWEYHPQYGAAQLVTLFTGTVADPSVARDYSGVFGDLLPLGGAYGDDSTIMWDGSLPTDETQDLDGDGIPDVWEELNGLDPLDPLDADDDPDRDGLSTRQEYDHGSNPFGNFSLTQDVPDFFATNYPAKTEPYLFLGEDYTDMDYMDDLWEAAYGLNTEMYDATGPNGDSDADGWSNLAEFQELANLTGSGGGLIGPQTNLFPNFKPLEGNAFYMSLLGDLSFLMNQGTNGTNAVLWTLSWNDPKDNRYHPVPEVIFRFQYAGKSRDLAAPRFVVLAYTDRSMEVPDASIRGLGDRVVTYPRYMALNKDNANSFSFEGDIREGANWFWGFMDLNSDSEYQDNEPAGFAGPVDVRWGSVGPIDIPLTDIRPNGFGRFSWAADPKAEAYEVTIVNRNVANSPVVYTRTFTPFRTFVHEGDLMNYGKLKKGFKNSGGYQWYVRSVYDNVRHDLANGMIYTKYTNPLPAPVLIWPVGNGRLRQSRDSFEWKMDASVTECQLTVKRSDGTVVMKQTFPPPARDTAGKYKMEMPIYIGDGVFEKGLYNYTLTVKNPAGSASATSQFFVRPGDYAGYSYSLSGDFIYPGKVTNGLFIAEAFTSPGFGGVAAGRCMVSNTISAANWPLNVMRFKISGLPADTYYVRVFLDQNTTSYPKYVADSFESQGWYAMNFYWPDSVVVDGNSTAKLKDWVKVLMRDLDNDRLPDDWEYLWNRNLTAFGLGDLRGYTPALNGILNVFECYGRAELGLNPK